MKHNKLSAAVLCGGRGQRMGVDKTNLKLGAETFLDHLCRSLATVAAHIVLVGRENQKLELPSATEWTTDANSDQGPLEGIASALKFLEPKAEFAFVTSCDAPLIRPQLMTFLLDQLGDKDAVMPTDGQHIYGLTAIYRTKLAMPIRHLLDKGIRRVIDLPQFLDVHLISLDDCRSADPDLQSFQNVNTPEEYSALLSKLGSPKSNWLQK